MPILEISSPWGTITSECDNISSKTIFHGLKQLMDFYNNGNHSQYIQRDIQGYKMLLDSVNQEYNCNQFLNLKQSKIRQGKRIKDNLVVIDFMKEHNLWKED